MGTLKLKGKILRVIDGDTVEMVVPVRMAKIDAMERTGEESKNPLSEEAKQYLKDRVEGKKVMGEFLSNDIYYRGIAYLYESGSNVGDEMLDKKLVERYSSKNHNNNKLDI